MTKITLSSVARFPEPCLSKIGLDKNNSYQGKGVGIEEIKVKNMKMHRQDKNHKIVPGGYSRYF